MRTLGTYLGSVKRSAKRYGLDFVALNHPEGLMLLYLTKMRGNFPNQFEDKYYRDMLKKAPTK